MYMGALKISDISTTFGPVTGGFNVTSAPAPATGDAASSVGGFFSQLPQLITAGLTITNAQRIANLNFDRIKAGQPPLSQASIAAVQPGVRVGLAPDIKNMLMFGGIGLGAILLIGTLTKKRR